MGPVSIRLKAFLRALSAALDGDAAVLSTRKTAYDQALHWADQSAKQGDPTGFYTRGLLRAPWFSGEHFLDLVKTGNPAVELLGLATDIKQAETLCTKEPYKSDARYAGHCADIAAYADLLSRDYMGGSGSSPDCDTATGYHCLGAGMSATDAQEAMQLMGAM